MLREQSVGSVLTLAGKVSDTNTVVEALPGTPLSVLTGLCYNPVVDAANVSEQDRYPVDPGAIMFRMIDASRTPDLSNSIPHDVAMENIVSIAAKAVMGTHQLAKNVVNPMIKQVVDRVEADVKAADIAAVNLLNVVPDAFRPIWDSPVLEGIINRYNDTGIEEQQVARILQPMEKQAIMELLITGVGRFDKEVEAWVADFPEGFIVDVYNNFFCRTTVSEFGNQNFSNFFGAQCDRETMLAIHLMARRLEKDIPEGVEMDLSDYRSYLIAVLSQSGRALCRVVEQRSKDAKMKLLVKKWPSISPDQLGRSEEMILVNPDIYNDWLQAGGSPEVLFGAFLLDRNGDYQSLLNDADKYKDVWTRQANLMRARASTQRFNTVVMAIRMAITGLINKAGEDELPVKDRSTLHTILAGMVDTLTMRDLEDLWGTCQRLVCRTLFAHTDAERFLIAMDNVGRANPNMDPRDAGLLATVDTVVAWVAAQMKVSVVTNNM